MSNPKEKEELAWVSFASAALASGKSVAVASNIADGMLERYDMRFGYTEDVPLLKVPSPVADESEVMFVSLPTTTEDETEEKAAEVMVKKAKKTPSKRAAKTKESAAKSDEAVEE